MGLLCQLFSPHDTGRGDGAEPPVTSLQRACMSAALLWVGMHLWHAVSSLDAHHYRWAAVIAIALCVAASGWAASPS